MAATELLPTQQGPEAEEGQEEEEQPQEQPERDESLTPQDRAREIGKLKRMFEGEAKEGAKEAGTQAATQAKRLAQLAKWARTAYSAIAAAISSAPAWVPIAIIIFIVLVVVVIGIAFYAYFSSPRVSGGTELDPAIAQDIGDIRDLAIFSGSPEAKIQLLDKNSKEIISWIDNALNSLARSPQNETTKELQKIFGDLRILVNAWNPNTTPDQKIANLSPIQKLLDQLQEKLDHRFDGKALLASGRVKFIHKNDEVGMKIGLITRIIEPGKGSAVPVDPRPPKILFKLSEDRSLGGGGFSLTVIHIVGSHHKNVAGTNNESRHFSARAIDIGTINGARYYTKYPNSTQQSRDQFQQQACDLMKWILENKARLKSIKPNILPRSVIGPNRCKDQLLAAHGGNRQVIKPISSKNRTDHENHVHIEY